MSGIILNIHSGKMDILIKSLILVILPLLYRMPDEERNEFTKKVVSNLSLVIIID